MRYQDHRQHQRARQGETAREYGEDAPRDPDARDLASFRLEEIEDVHGAEDGWGLDLGGDAGECADDVVVQELADAGVGGLQIALLVDSLYSMLKKMFRLAELDHLRIAPLARIERT